jgi:hypothetical protein
MMLWIKTDPRVDLGFLPSFLSDTDPRPASIQIDTNYGHGGGWRPQPGFALLKDHTLKYPGDPPIKPLAMTNLRHELICFYPYSYLAIFQPDGTFEVCRVD